MIVQPYVDKECMYIIIGTTYIAHISLNSPAIDLLGTTQQHTLITSSRCHSASVLLPQVIYP